MRTRCQLQRPHLPTATLYVVSRASRLNSRLSAHAALQCSPPLAAAAAAAAALAAAVQELLRRWWLPQLRARPQQAPRRASRRVGLPRHRRHTSSPMLKWRWRSPQTAGTLSPTPQPPPWPPPRLGARRRYRRFRCTRSLPCRLHILAPSLRPRRPSPHLPFSFINFPHPPLPDSQAIKDSFYRIIFYLLYKKT